MDKALVELLARRAGLDKALAKFPEDGRSGVAFLLPGKGWGPKHHLGWMPALAAAGRRVIGWSICRHGDAELAYLASVQLSHNPSTQVLEGRPSRSLGQGRPLASIPLRVSRAPNAGISTVHIP